MSKHNSLKILMILNVCDEAARSADTRTLRFLHFDFIMDIMIL